MNSKQKRQCVLMVGTVLSITLSSLAQVQSRRQVIDVNENGAFVRTQTSTPEGEVLVDRSRGTITGVTTPRWAEGDGGLGWICQSVSLGDDGAILLAGKGLNNESVTMYGTGSSTQVFDFSTLGSEYPIVSVADHAPVGASMVVVNQDQGGGYDFEGTVYVWSTTSDGTPDWSYTFPRTLNFFGGGVAVSDNGQIILAWKADPNIGKCRIEAFRRNGTSISSGQLDDGGGNFHARQVRLSNDGSRAYLNIGTHAFIYDVATATVEFDHVIGGSFDSHAFSGDGTHFAYGFFGYFRVYKEDSPGVWSLEASKTFAGGTYVAYLDLNEDGSRLGYEIQRYSPQYDHIEIGMYDVPNNTDLFNESYDAPGTAYQLVCSGCEVDDAGDSVAGCSWGDSFNSTPEAFVYDAAGIPTCELDLRGSAFDLSMDSAGDVVAFGSKATHANQFGRGGDVTLADAYPQDLHVLGYARAGQPVTLTIAHTGQQAQIAICTALGNSNTPLGRSELNLGTLLRTIGPVSIPNGGLNRSLNIPNALAGRLVHLQAGITGGQNPHLTNKVSVRIQP